MNNLILPKCCGVDPILMETEGIGFPTWEVYCPECDKSSGDFANRDEAISFWNSKSKNKPYFDSIWVDVPMPVYYTCGCGLFVHPSKREPKAIHIKDCEYYNK